MKQLIDYKFDVFKLDLKKKKKRKNLKVAKFGSICNVCFYRL